MTCLEKDQKESQTLLIEIEGIIKLFKGLRNLLNTISKDLIGLNYSFTMGLAHTPKAASLLAANSRLLSQPPPFKQAPSQQDCLLALRQLPLDSLQTEAQYLDKLSNMGLSQLGQLLDLPRAALGKRFGKDFQHYLQRLTGERNDPQQPVQPATRFTSQLFFLEPINNSQMLVFPMQRLLDEFCRFLELRQLRCNQFNWYLYEGRSQAGQNGKRSRLTIQLSQAQADKAAFLSLSRIRLDKLCLQEVHTLELRASRFVQAHASNRRLFDELDGTPPAEGLDALLDKLQARLGPHTLHGLSCKAEHLPEYASKTRPVNEQATTLQQDHPPVRPTWLLHQPVRAQQRTGQLFWRGPLELLQGPERIENTWWEQTQQRDYYIARHQNGGLYWVYQDLRNKSWYVQGVFA